MYKYLYLQIKLFIECNYVFIYPSFRHPLSPSHQFYWVENTLSNRIVVDPFLWFFKDPILDIRFLFWFHYVDGVGWRPQRWISTKKITSGLKLLFICVVMNLVSETHLRLRQDVWNLKSLKKSFYGFRCFAYNSFPS